jgi:hypothetical protein
MSKFKFYFIALAVVSVLFSCDKNNSDADYELLHDYGVQYAYDLGIIQDYLKTHYIVSITDAAGTPEDQDIKFGLITPENPQQSLWDSPMLDSIEVERNSMTYTIYYLKQRMGDPAGKSPSRADNVMVAYDGAYLKYISEKDTISTDPLELTPDNVTKLRTYRFDYSLFPNFYFALDEVIQGWSEVLPLFKSGVLTDGGPGTPATYTNFGAGVMFIPSGLGYYNVAGATLPAYAQLMFKFKLYDVRDSDPDGDGIFSNDEDLNHNGIFTDDDTDGDGIYNYRDTDDDGDGHLTRNEIKNASGELYTFDLIPDCSGNNSNPDRIKRYLDFSCTKESE